jgi:hypothetical protein
MIIAFCFALATVHAVQTPRVPWFKSQQSLAGDPTHVFVHMPKQFMCLFDRHFLSLLVLDMLHLLRLPSICGKEQILDSLEF